MNKNKDLEKYLRSKSINSTSQSNYFNHLQVKNNNPNILSNDAPVDIFSKLLDDRIIFLSTEIDDYVCNIIKAQLLYLESISDDVISIYIDSPGGSVYSGLGLLDVMEFITPKISTINTGLAASMAAVILCSGDIGLRKSLKRSRTMIHQPIGGGYIQQSSDITIEAVQINSLKKELCEIISEKTGQVYDKVSKDSDRNYWMNSKDAKKYGMIDEILTKRKTPLN